MFANWDHYGCWELKDAQRILTCEFVLEECVEDFCFKPSYYHRTLLQTPRNCMGIVPCQMTTGSHDQQWLLDVAGYMLVPGPPGFMFAHCGDAPTSSDIAAATDSGDFGVQRCSKMFKVQWLVASLLQPLVGCQSSYKTSSCGGSGSPCSSCGSCTCSSTISDSSARVPTKFQPQHATVGSPMSLPFALVALCCLRGGKHSTAVQESSKRE